MSRLALFQTTLHRNCHPSFAAAAAASLVAVGVGVADADGLTLGELVAEVVADAEGDADFDADAVGAAVVGGASCVGVGDGRLCVGCADRAAVVCGAVSRVVPGIALPAVLVPTDAVVGVAAWLALGAGEVELVIDMWWPPDVSSSATIAATPHTATPTPVAARRCRLRGEPAVRSECRNLFVGAVG